MPTTAAEIRIIRSHSEYEPIRVLLRIALANRNANGNEFIKIMVRDAQGLARNTVTRYQIDHRLYVYSSELSRFDRIRLLEMDPEHLKNTDLHAMLKFFE